MAGSECISGRMLVAICRHDALSARPPRQWPLNWPCGVVHRARVPREQQRLLVSWRIRRQYLHPGPSGDAPRKVAARDLTKNRYFRSYRVILSFILDKIIRDLPFLKFDFRTGGPAVVLGAFVRPQPATHDI